MQCLRETLDAREFETRLTALRHTGRRFDASDLAEITILRNRVDDCDTVRRAIDASLPYETHAVAEVGSMENAIAAIVDYARSRGEDYDTAEENDGIILAWGYPLSDESEDILWYVRLRVIKETDL
jgi:hypothetical protein